MDNPMFVYDERLADVVFAYCRERLALDPVPLDFGGSHPSFEVLDGLLGEEGHDPAEVLALFSEHLATAVISCDSPRFLSFIPAAPTKAALLFDMIVSCSSLQGTSWLEAAGAIAAENQALGFLAGLAGLPPGTGGCFVSGGSIANLSALVVARAAHAEGRAAAGGRPGRPCMAVSEEAHASVTSALRILGVDPLLVPAVDHRLTGAALEGALAAAPDGSVVGVVATAGTTNAGIIDDLAGIAEVAARRSLWFHVDAAYGGAGLFAPVVRGRFAGIERADSVVIDPHKWLYAPFDCAALLYRQPERARRVHAQEASYLDVIHDPDNPVWNPSDYAVHLTRRARGLPLWFSLAVYGAAAYRQAVETVLDTAWRSAALIDATPYLELAREPELSIVLFRRVGWEAEDYRRWSERLLASQVGFVTPSSWEGTPVARLAFLHPGTTLEMIGEIIATMA
ncbi:MAG TPA: pyridoxal-dependent decarboxylase [Acidimicrobiales bacterium]|nr:pyridoxal-dependent decarboxylase [Acidimicrobiales bacterium]